MCPARTLLSALAVSTTWLAALLCEMVSRQSVLGHAVLSRFSHVQLCAAPMDCSPQAPLSMGFSRQEHWRGLPFHSPGHLPDPGIEPARLTPSLHWQTGSLPLASPGVGMQKSPLLHWILHFIKK